MSIHLMLFTAATSEPTADVMLKLMDSYPHLQMQGKELSGGISSWTMGLVGKKTTRNGAIRAYYWRAEFNEVSSADALVVLDETLTHTERKRFINQLTDRYDGHIDRQDPDQVVLYRFSGFSLEKLEADYPFHAG